MAKYVWWTTIYRKPFKTVGVDRFSWAINSRKLERRAQPWGPADISANCFDENLFFGCIIIFTRVHAQRATNGTKPNHVYHSMMVCNIGNFKRNPILKKKKLLFDSIILYGNDLYKIVVFGCGYAIHAGYNSRSITDGLNLCHLTAHILPIKAI